MSDNILDSKVAIQLVEEEDELEETFEMNDDGGEEPIDSILNDSKFVMFI